MQEYWNYHNTKMIELKQIYNKTSKQTQNRLQELLDTFNFTFGNLYNITDSKTKNRINIYIEIWKEQGLLTGYFGMLAKNIYSKTRVKNSEILQLLIYGSYIEEQSKLKDKELDIFKEDVNYYYNEGIKEVNKANRKQKEYSVIPDAIFLALLDMAMYNGLTWEQYIETTIRYNAQQIYQQVIYNIQQQKELKIQSNEFQRVINQQNNQKLCINGDKISGAVDLQTIGLNNLAKIEGIKSLANEAKVRFIAVIDGKETDMCHSLDGQVFYIDKENVFDRYYGETQKNLRLVRVKCKGLVVGLNLPPISHHFHFCRSTITYQYDKINDIELEQGKYNGKKEKMNWQEQNEKLESTIIKPELYSNKAKEYRIKKYENEIMKLYNKNGNENMCILDIDTGELIGNITEGKNRTTVGLDTKTMLSLAIRRKNSVIAIHNHPENYSFSLTDILSYNKINQIDTMVLLTNNYKYYLKSNISKQYKKEELIQLYKTIEKEIKKKYNSLNGVEKRDLTNQKFFKKVGWIYEKEKN